jgi:hypothetical protein
MVSWDTRVPSGIPVQRFVMFTDTADHVGSFFRWDARVRLTWTRVGAGDGGSPLAFTVRCPTFRKGLRHHGFPLLRMSIVYVPRLHNTGDQLGIALAT